MQQGDAQTQGRGYSAAARGCSGISPPIRRVSAVAASTRMGRAAAWASGVQRITGAESANVVGLCLGGTLATMLLAHLAAVGDLYRVAAE